MTTLRNILIATALIASSTTTFSVSAANSIVTEITPYVYPANRPAAPKSMTFMPDGESYLMANETNTQILQYETKSGAEMGVVFDCATTREGRINSFEGFILSPDASKLLVYRDSESIYRRSTCATYYVYEVRSRILRPLSIASKQQSPVFAPDNRQIAFVVNGNIYIKKLDYNTEVAVTTDGAPGQIINGVPDWVYEEEFATTCSMTWAPDSETLSYLKYNETQVPLYSIPLYQGACNPKDKYALYPGQMSFKYPVAGEANSVVTLHSYDVANRKTKDLTLPDANIEYIPRIMYAGDATKLIVATLNREQTRMEIYSVNPKSTVAKSLIVEQHKAWLNPATYEQITLTDKSLIIHSARSGYNHLYEYSLAGALIRQITSGDFDVTDCYGVDATGAVYYRSAKSSPLNRVVSKLDIKGRTTDLTPAEATASATFAPAMNYYRLSVSDALTPPVYTMCNTAGKTLRTLEDNASYAANFANAPRKEFFTVTSDGNQLNAYMIKPTNFDSSKRYPVIMWQYSGPGSQQVLNSWQMDWDYFAAEQGFIVVCVDGRGTGARGRAFMDVVYKNLGYYETIDQVNAAREIAALPYVDADRIGIAGWSYGGYEALMCASAPDAPYAAAVAIAPVTDWRYYDTIYAERYMLTPRQNEDGYRDSAPINRTKNIDCDLLLMYGTADDNVHPANTLEYVARLQAEGTLCDMLLFPNMNHSINGCNARAVVYAKMVDFFSKMKK